MIHIPATMGADLFALAGRTTIQYRADRYTSPDNHGWYYEIPDTSAGGIPSDDLIGPFPTEAAAVDAFLAKRPHAERQDTTTALPYERRAELLEANDPETMQEIARLGVGERTVLGMSDPIVRTF